MAKPRLELNLAGVRELLRSDGVRADLERRARAIAAAAGDGHRVESGLGRNRARAVVITESVAAKRAEAESRNLTSAIDAGRD